MFGRWFRDGRTTSTDTPSAEQPAEQHLPLLVVAAHGILAVTTVVLVLLAAVDAGG